MDARLNRLKDGASDALELRRCQTRVTRDAVAELIACGPSRDAHAVQVRAYVDADVDGVCVQQIGPDMDGFFAQLGTRCSSATAPMVIEPASVLL
jgi:hypothetical protein